uniref:Uncharacterized protein n=1 Tax=Physcomitrium patens TaxID=3218 RepID=A0A2K1JDM0_PHYPA|nr:hypothetical protein PHYPA_019905 [Physcomitrium patens]
MTEAFTLKANDLKFITDHFRDRIFSEQLKWTTRYYSTTWRMWAAVTIQLAWRRHKTSRGNQSRKSSAEKIQFVDLSTANPIQCCNRTVSVREHIR